MASEPDNHQYASNTAKPDVEDVIWQGYRQGWPVGQVVAKLLAAGARDVTADEVRQHFSGLDEFVRLVAEALGEGHQVEATGR